jgi:hypothetical protein
MLFSCLRFVHDAGALQVVELYKRVNRNTDLITRVGMDLDGLPAKRPRRSPGAAAAAAAAASNNFDDCVSIGYAAASMHSFEKLLHFLQHSEQGRASSPFGLHDSIV